MAVRASMVAKAMREQKDALLARSLPSVPTLRRFKRKNSREQDSHGSGSSKRARAEKHPDEEVRTAHWVQNAEKIVREMRGDASSSLRSRELDNPSSVFKSSFGKDTRELYRYTLRHTDQLALADVSLIKLEDVAAHHSLATNAVIHHLLLRAAHWKKEVESCEIKLKETIRKAEERGRTELGQKFEELEQSLNDSKLENTMLKHLLEESNSKVEQLELTRGHERDEFRSAMNITREETLRSFMNSNTFATLVAKKAAVFQYDAFSKCRSQAMKLGAFRKGFDPSRLDPFKNENLEDPVFEDDVGAEEEDEFAYLLQDPDRANPAIPEIDD